MGSVSYHIMPLVVHGLRGGHTHANTHACIQIFTDRSNSKKSGTRRPVAGTWFK